MAVFLEYGQNTSKKWPYFPNTAKKTSKNGRISVNRSFHGGFVRSDRTQFFLFFH
jgi:hypothetical protein